MYDTNKLVQCGSSINLNRFISTIITHTLIVKVSHDVPYNRATVIYNIRRLQNSNVGLIVPYQIGVSTTCIMFNVTE